MRPVRLDMHGFAAFREPTTVDFTDADYFALVGPTGSGKSTVLDAICFALYGTVPRWRHSGSVAHALAPSATEARVRLVFESAGRRYVATRVVRRDGKGRVKTAAAALERMPDGFDLRRLDEGLTTDDLGEVLAGTPTETDAAVAEVIGLPYQQFVTCVVLPQGEFAEFLHARPATRQQILVNLLGFSVYERIRERAVERAARAEAHLAATDQLLEGLTGIDDAALEAARQAVRRLDALVERVDATVPELAAAHAARERAEAALAERDARITQLSAVAVPPQAAALAAAAAETRSTLAAAAAAVAAAEETEEKLRAQLAAAGDAARLRGLLDAYAQRERLIARREPLAAQLAEARHELDAATAALAQAREQAARAERELEASREAYTRAQAQDRAVGLRAHLVAGEPCPVCEQPVTTIPPVPETSAVARAKAGGESARAKVDAARAVVAERDAAVRQLEQLVAAATAEAGALDAQLSELDRRLAGAPDAETLRQDLAAIADVERRLADAAGAVRAAREAHRRAQADVEAAERRLADGWRQFDATRDALAALGPPPADRDDLAAAWEALAGWARQQAGAHAAARAEDVAAVQAATDEVEAVRARLVALFADAGLPAPDDDGFARAATVAAERARAELDALVAKREQAERLARERAGHERDARVARALAGHLRANNFEAWLLSEALDRLVEGASVILRELSGGQYDLVHEDREFYVVDHHDAGLRRAVRTLSGGETFQASLALALALSEQLAGLSSTSASLESIMLDEGFGTLDAASLEVVAATLETLAARGDRMVGVVTHVPALAERVPVRFEVVKDARTARVTRVGL
ncbi:MAG: SMC family ATPase [Micromonosporaceae bacterium]